MSSYHSMSSAPDPFSQPLFVSYRAITRCKESDSPVLKLMIFLFQNSRTSDSAGKELLHFSRNLRWIKSDQMVDLDSLKWQSPHKARLVTLVPGKFCILSINDKHLLRDKPILHIHMDGEHQTQFEWVDLYELPLSDIFELPINLRQQLQLFRFSWEKLSSLAVDNSAEAKKFIFDLTLEQLLPNLDEYLSLFVSELNPYLFHEILNNSLDIEPLWNHVDWLNPQENIKEFLAAVEFERMSFMLPKVLNLWEPLTHFLSICQIQAFQIQTLDKKCLNRIFYHKLIPHMTVEQIQNIDLRKIYKKNLSVLLPRYQDCSPEQKYFLSSHFAKTALWDRWIGPHTRQGKRARE